MTEYYTLLGGAIREFNIPYAQFKEFKKQFVSLVSDGITPVYQDVPAETTIIFKLRFEFDESAGYNIVNSDIIGRLVYVCQEVVAQVTGHTTSSELVALVMSSTQIEKNDLFYEEIYIQFPWIKTSSQFIAERMVPNLRLFMDQIGIYSQMDLMPVNELEDTIITDIYRGKDSVWPLPGSYIDGNLLSITHVFDRITSEQANDGSMVAYPPEAYFNNYQLPDGSEYDISTSFFFTNLNGFESIMKKKTQKDKNRDVTSRMIEERQKEVKRTPAELCRIFVGMLAPERYASENSRNKIGQVIFNATKSADQGLELWKESVRYKLEALNNSFPDLSTLAAQLGIDEDEVSEARENNPELAQTPLRMTEQELEDAIISIQNACDEFWQYFEYTDSTIGTLRYWAATDNPAQHQAFLQKDTITLTWRCLNPNASHTDVAKLVYAKYCDQICCANIKDNIWFGWWQNRWHELDKCHYMRIKLSDEITVMFDKVLDECQSEYKRAVGDEDKEKWARLAGACNKMIKDLKTVRFKNDVITECAERFYDPEFISKLDEDRTLIGLPNGVYELATGLFRPGKPEDFITLSTKAKYNPAYHWEHPRVKEVVYYMKTVYPDRTLRHYVQKAYGSILEGGNMNKDFYNMVGEGDNSKSMVAKGLKLALGKYISKIPVSMIMGKRGNADNATPHLADKKGIRALFVEEPPKGQSNVSVVKELSGNDDILSRALFKMPIIFSPQWKLFVWTNHMLEAPAEEKAYWNRQKVIDHESTFQFDAPLTEAEQFEKKLFPRDPFFDRKLVAMAEPLLWCLFQWYGFFKKEGLIPPERVVKATNVAKLRNDIYLQYIQASLEQGTQHDFMTVDALFEDFRGWHTSAYGSKALPPRNYFEDEMSKQGHIGSKPTGPMADRWIGIKLKNKVTPLGAFGNAGAAMPTVVM